jgi:hypothetical protein
MLWNLKRNYYKHESVEYSQKIFFKSGNGQLHVFITIALVSG